MRPTLGRQNSFCSHADRLAHQWNELPGRDLSALRGKLSKIHLERTHSGLQAWLSDWDVMTTPQPLGGFNIGWITLQADFCLSSLASAVMKPL